VGKRAHWNAGLLVITDGPVTETLKNKESTTRAINLAKSLTEGQRERERERELY
jgi:hypothetical protein